MSRSTSTPEQVSPGCGPASYGRAPRPLRPVVLVTCVVLACLSMPIRVAPLRAADGLTPIPAIQGRGLASPLAGRTVNVAGWVTGITDTGFFFQDTLGDGDPSTSDGLFVYTRTRPALTPGTCVRVEGAQVAEFYAKTELNRAQRIAAADVCPAQPPAPLTVTWSQPGRAASEHWEALEGMLVRLLPPTAVVYGPARRYAGGEVELALLDARQTYLRTAGHLFQHETVDGYPASDALLYFSNRLGATLPAADWGDRLHAPAAGWLGVVDYHFGKYQLLLLPDQTTHLTRPERTHTLPAPARDDEYTVCSFNVHGLGLGAQQLAAPDRYAAALTQRAAAIAGPLQGCTVIALQETGSPQDADALAATLAAEFGLDYIAAALPGPATANPDFPLTLSFLVRSERVSVLSLDQVQACSAQDHGIAAPGVCTPGTYPLFDRPPLLAQLLIAGPWPSPQRLWLINNHWKSKAGDERANAQLRSAQAQAVAARVATLVTEDPSTPGFVIGDLNDFVGGPALAIVETAVTPPMQSLLDLVAPGDRYTYLFNGAAQALDHAVVTSGLIPQIAAVHPLHINADYADPDPAADSVRSPLWLRSSDHDPLWVRVRPGGAATLGGNLAYPGVTVRALDAQDNEIAATISDHSGDFRLWGLPPGQMIDLHFELPPGLFTTQTHLRLLTASGYQEPVLPAIIHSAPRTALRLAHLTPSLAAHILTAPARP